MPEQYDPFATDPANPIQFRQADEVPVVYDPYQAIDRGEDFDVNTSILYERRKQEKERHFAAPPGSAEADESERHFNIINQAILAGAEPGKLSPDLQLAVDEAKEAAIRMPYLEAKGLVGGATAGLSDIVFNAAEKATGGEITPQTEREALASGVARLAGGIPMAMSVYGAVGKLTRLPGVVKALAGTGILAKDVVLPALVAGSAISSASTLSEAIVNPDSRKDALTNWAIGSLMPVPGSIVGRIVPRGTMNVAAQVLSQFAYDVMADSPLIRNGIKEQGFKNWFLYQELPQLAISMGFALRDATNPAFEAQRQALLGDMSVRWRGELQAKYNKDVNAYVNKLPVPGGARTPETDKVVDDHIAARIQEMQAKAEETSKLVSPEDMAGMAARKQGRREELITRPLELMTREEIDIERRRIISKPVSEITRWDAARLKRLNDLWEETPELLPAKTELISDQTRKEIRERIANPPTSEEIIRNHLSDIEGQDVESLKVLIRRLSDKGDRYDVNSLLEDWHRNPTDVPLREIIDEVSYRVANPEIVEPALLPPSTEGITAQGETPSKPGQPQEATEKVGSTDWITGEDEMVKQGFASRGENAPAKEPVSIIEPDGSVPHEYAPIPHDLSPQAELNAEVVTGLIAMTPESAMNINTKKNALNTTRLALAYLRRMDNVTPENVHQILSDIATEKGPYSLKGVGETGARMAEAIYTAKSPEEAIASINVMRAQQNASDGKNRPMLSLEPVPPDVQKIPDEMNQRVQQEVVPYLDRSIRVANKDEFRKNLMGYLNKLYRGSLNRATTDQEKLAVLANMRLVGKLESDMRQQQMSPTTWGKIKNWSALNFTSLPYRADNLSMMLMNADVAPEMRLAADKNESTERIMNLLFQRGITTSLTRKTQYHAKNELTPEDMSVQMGSNGKKLAQHSIADLLNTLSAKDISNMPEEKRQAWSQDINDDMENLTDYRSFREAEKLIAERTTATPTRKKQIDKWLNENSIPFWSADPTVNEEAQKNNRFRRVFDTLYATFASDGPGGIAVKANRTYDFAEAWEKYGNTILKLEQRAARKKAKGEELSKEDQARLTAALAEVDKATPRWNNPADPDNPVVPRDIMLEAVKNAETMNEESFREWLAKETWGTRKTYFMQENMEKFIADPISGMTRELPDLEYTEKKGGKVSTPGAARTRTEETGEALKTRNIFDAAYRHLRSLEMGARVRPHVNKIISAVNMDQYLPQKTRDEVIHAMKVIAGGGYEPRGPILAALEGLTKTFWRFMPTSPSRYLWYGARQLPQQYLTVLGQVPGTEYAKGFISSMARARRPGDPLNKWLHDDLNSTVNQMRTYWQEIGGNDSDMITFLKNPTLRRLVSKYDKGIHLMLNMPDMLPRMSTGIMFYAVGERTARDYNAGKISWAEVNRKLRLDGFTPLQEQRIIDSFLKTKSGDAADIAKFASDFATEKTAMTQGLFSPIQRTLIEQRRVNKTFMGVWTWPRFMTEHLYYSGFKNVMQGIQSKDYAKGVQGLRTISSYLFTSYALAMLYTMIMGNRGKDSSRQPISPVSNLFYKPGSPGLSMFTDFIDTMDQIQFQDPDKFAANAGKLADEVSGWMLPFIKYDLPDFYDAVNDTRGASNARVLSEVFSGRVPKAWGAQAWEDRTALEAWQQAMLGTQETHKSVKRRVLEVNGPIKWMANRYDWMPDE